MTPPPAETPRAAWRHFLAIPTRWIDNDLYGHVNNVRYYEYFDTVINKYLIDDGGLDIHQGAIVGYELSNGMFGRPEQKRILRAEDVQAIGKDAIITAVTDLTQLETLESMATADDFGHYPPRPGLEPEAPRPPIEERSVGDASAPIIDPSLDPGMPLREPRPGE